MIEKQGHQTKQRRQTKEPGPEEEEKQKSNETEYLHNFHCVGPYREKEVCLADILKFTLCW
jgi:hypothetical protein